MPEKSPLGMLWPEIYTIMENKCAALAVHVLIQLCQLTLSDFKASSLRDMTER